MTIHTKAQRTAMKVSKIEELAKKIAMFPDSDDLLPEDMLIDYNLIKVGDVYNLITQAKQAGIDEAVEAITKHLEVKSDTEIWISPQKLRDTIKALQDNK